MFRRLLAVLAVALLATSCSSSDTLATVNGEPITKGDLYAVYPEYEGGDTITGEELRAAVGTLIAQEMVVQGAEDEFGYVVDDAALDERVANPPARYAPILDPQRMTDGTNDAQRRGIARNTLIMDVVAPPVLVEQYGGYEELLNERPDMVTKVCIRFIQVETAEEADAVLERLGAGEDFATLANELSLARANEGGLLVDADGQCLVSAAVFGGELTAAAIATPIEEPFGPLPVGQTFGVFRVEQRVAPASAAELEANPMEFIDVSFANEAMSGWRSDLNSVAVIEVSPTLGRWSPVAGAIGAPNQ